MIENFVIKKGCSFVKIQFNEFKKFEKGEQ